MSLLATTNFCEDNASAENDKNTFYPRVLASAPLSSFGSTSVVRAGRLSPCVTLSAEQER